MRRNVALPAWLILTVIVAAGCPDIDPAARDLKSIADSVELWKAGVEAGDWDKMLAIRSTVTNPISPDFFDGAKVDSINAKTTIVDIDSAKVSPVRIIGKTGTVTLELELLKEKGHWYVIYLWPK